MNFEQQLKEIAERVVVTSPNSYQLDGQSYSIYQNYTWDDYVGPLNQFGHNQTADKTHQLQQFEQRLAQILYAQMYCGIPEGKDMAALPKLGERDAFMQTLSAANHTSETLDQNWKIYHLDSQSIWAEKNGKLRQAYSNSYIPAIPNVQLAVNQFIHFVRQKENRHIQQVFYYVHSNQYMENDAPQVRIYWHIKPEGAAPLIELLTHDLNEHMIAFNFKCLNHPSLYVRADSAVLYLEKRDFDYTLRVLKPNLNRLSDYLLDSHPLFTQTIAQGISFAEDPGHGQSFGMYRCQLVAKALLNAYQYQQNHPEFTERSQLNLNCILDIFQSKGIELPRLHLNPNSFSLPVEVPDASMENVL